MFPCFLWRFVYGQFLSFLTFVPPKPRPGDTGRLAIDPSSLLDLQDDGVANAQILPMGQEGAEVENLGVAYGTAMVCFLQLILGLQKDHPGEDVLLSSDNILAAFRRLLYHPDMAILFASVLQEFLVIPVGLIFGGCNSPSFYMVLGELCAHLASASTSRLRLPGFPSLSKLLLCLCLVKLLASGQCPMIP